LNQQTDKIVLKAVSYLSNLTPAPAQHYDSLVSL